MKHFEFLEEVGVHPPIWAKVGWYGDQRRQMPCPVKEYDGEGGVVPASPINRHILGKILKPRSFHRFIAELPSIRYELRDAPSFPVYDLVDELKNTAFEINAGHFIIYPAADGSVLCDTAMSERGLRELMKYLSMIMGFHGLVFESIDDFEGYLKRKGGFEHLPAACLITTDSSGRHVTGVYAKANSGGSVEVFFFDTFGITLPGVGCGDRGYSESRLPIESCFRTLNEFGIRIHIMPINTVIPMQRDPYSCLSATFLFFQAMQSCEYQFLKNIGICECYGYPACDYEYVDGEKKHFYYQVPVGFYAVTYLPILVGVQNALALTFMLDPTTDGDDGKYKRVVRLQANWQTRTPKSDRSSRTENTFWQHVYVLLLKWLDSCYGAVQKGETIPPLPDFKKLMVSRDKIARQKCKLEYKIDGILDAGVAESDANASMMLRKKQRKEGGGAASSDDLAGKFNALTVGGGGSGGGGEGVAATTGWNEESQSSGRPDAQSM